MREGVGASQAQLFYQTRPSLTHPGGMTGWLLCSQDLCCFLDWSGFLKATALALYNAMTSSGSRRSLFEQASLLLRAIACPLEHFDAIGFAARRVEDFAVAYALESGAHQADSQHVAGRI